MPLSYFDASIGPSIRRLQGGVFNDLQFDGIERTRNRAEPATDPQPLPAAGKDQPIEALFVRPCRVHRGWKDTAAQVAVIVADQRQFATPEGAGRTKVRSRVQHEFLGRIACDVRDRDRIGYLIPSADQQAADLPVRRAL